MIQPARSIPTKEVQTQMNMKPISRCWTKKVIPGKSRNRMAWVRMPSRTMIRTAVMKE
jgi:hypothetical protein